MLFIYENFIPFIKHKNYLLLEKVFISWIVDFYFFICNLFLQIFTKLLFIFDEDTILTLFDI